MTTLNQTWDLEVIFPGGSASPELAAYIKELVALIDTIEPQVKALNITSPVSQWEQVLDSVQQIMVKNRTAAAFVSCLTAQNTQDKQAKILLGQIRQNSARFGSVLTNFDDKLEKITDIEWEQFLAQPQFTELQFILNERRQRAKNRLCAHRESLANDLSVDGYHAWGELYNTVVGRMSMDVELEGAIKTVSMGQANNLLSHADRKVRQQIFTGYEQAWEQKSELFNTALNHLGGFRLTLYRHRKWNDVLQEPLEINRMSPDTLNAMWDTVTKNKAKVVEFLNRKAELLGVKRLAWYDVEAPLGSTQSTVSYDQGADFIVEQFAKFDPDLADFATMAFKERWIEAEDRAHKRPGGFCTSFPDKDQSRIFMTYSGTLSNVSTLAHELGHAYHSKVLHGLEPLNKNYAMNVAETASTFGEMLVADASIAQATDKQERITLLEDKIGRTVAFFMNIHARFLFELEFYKRRKNGLASVPELNEIMIAAQKEAYMDSLETYHPYFWASKLHFYITGTPFYNFPYTFGYLFSSGIYARAKAEGSGFAAKYRDLLRDSGRMRVETLANKHLGVDLTKPDFWQDAVNLSVKDIDLFLELTKK